jgi:hypothetical protein
MLPGRETRRYPTRELYRYRRPNVRALGTGDIYFAGNTWRGGLGNYVKQYLAHLTRTGADRVPLFILQRVDLTVSVQGKNHWFSVHLLYLLQF